MRRTQDHWSSVRQGLIRLAVARARQKNASEEELSMLTSLSSSASLSSKSSSKSSTKTVIEMRYTESIPDFRFLEESINWVDQKLVSFTRFGFKFSRHWWCTNNGGFCFHFQEHFFVCFGIVFGLFFLSISFISLFPWYHWFMDSIISSIFTFINIMFFNLFLCSCMIKIRFIFSYYSDFSVLFLHFICILFQFVIICSIIFLVFHLYFFLWKLIWSGSSHTLIILYWVNGPSFKYIYGKKFQFLKCTLFYF